MPEILKTSAQHSEEYILTRAVTILSGGGVIAYPTETYYGLGVDATNEKAIHKIYQIKRRNLTNPISIIISARKDVYPLVLNVTPAAEKLMDTFWPGALTIVFEASKEVLSILTAKTGKIGIRVSGNIIARTIAQKLGSPITATSANLTGEAECSCASDVIGQIGEQIDAIVDLGHTTGDSVSTIIDVTCHPPLILREGTVTRKSIEKTLSVSKS
jgi:L-threonylcarbamoyladenylate synthase